MTYKHHKHIPAISSCFLLVPALLLGPGAITATSVKELVSAPLGFGQYLKYGSNLVQHVMFEGLITLQVQPCLTTFTVCGIVAIEGKSSCQGREDALTASLEWLHPDVVANYWQPIAVCGTGLVEDLVELHRKSGTPEHTRTPAHITQLCTLFP